MACIHGFSGLGSPFRTFVDPMRGVADVVGLRARGIGPEEVPFESYDELLSTYASAIAEEAAGRPVLLVGWSLGGLIAVDLAARLGELGEDLLGLVLLDTIKPSSPRSFAMSAKGPETFDEWCRARLEQIATTPSPGDLASGADLSVAVARAAVARGMVDEALLDADAADLDRIVRVWQGLDRIMQERPEPSVFCGPTLVARAADTTLRNEDPLLGWSSVCPNAAAVEVRYGHYGLTQTGAAREIAGHVRDWLPRTTDHAAE